MKKKSGSLFLFATFSISAIALVALLGYFFPTPGFSRDSISMIVACSTIALIASAFFLKGRG